MFDGCKEKQRKMQEMFDACHSAEEKYHKLIELGKEQVRLNKADKIPAHLVPGCQSQMYLVARCRNEKIFFETESDALISAGLAVVLVKVYSGESPQTVLQCPPDYLEKLGIMASLTPHRAGGLASIFLRMKQEALKCLLLQEEHRKDWH